jgi:TonB-linked SusC/RagA family outer membrane protein
MNRKIVNLNAVRKIWISFCVVCIGTLSLFAQGNVTVVGTVSDEKGEPLPGVNIIVKGTTSGTISNVDGKFTLEASPSATLVISYIGYATQEIVVGNRTNLQITLVESALGLDEVVVVGYGTAKKKDITGAVVRADLTTLGESPNVSLGQLLHGTVPGLNVGAVTTAGSDPSISIRGRTSISGSNSPLIVLDGIVYHGSLVDININDIESIDILKDASASAIYGAQASNGVILISSKTVKAMTKPIIEYSGVYTLQATTNKNMKPMNRDEWLKFVGDAFLSESRTGADMLSPNPSFDVSTKMMDATSLDGYMNGTETNWFDLLSNDTPYIQSHNLSVRGRSELSNYFMSFGYTDQLNLMNNDKYKRFNVRLNLDSKITNWLKIGTQSFFTLSDYSGVSSSGSAMPPVVAYKDAETDELLTFLYKSQVNPLLNINLDDDNKRYNFFGNFYADANIPFIDGLNYRLNVSQNLVMSRYFYFSPYAENMQGTGQKTNSSQYDWTVDNILTYKKTFGKHDINATFVYGAEKRQYETTQARGSFFANPALGYNYLQASDVSQQRVTSSASGESSLYSMFRLGYSFNNRYSFTGTYRRDGFSGFGKLNKFATFPSAAVAWRISEEEFLQNRAPWIDNLKLRLSYGLNGNRTVSSYQTLSTVTSADMYAFGDGGSAEKGIWLSAMENGNLKWETTKSFNTGLDFSFFKGRLSGTLEYYKSQTYDLLYYINIPLMNNNIGSIAANIGKLENHGQELSITGIPVQTKDFSWELTYNYTLNRNKIVSILGIDADGDGKEDDLVGSGIFIGHPYGVAYDYEMIGMWQLSDYNAGTIPTGFTYGTYKVRDINGDGQYSADADRTILGYYDPSYRFSIQNTLKYKNLELKVFVYSVQGGKDYFYDQPGNVLQNPGNIYQSNSFKFDYWTPENPNARYRQIGYYTPTLGYAYSPYIQRNFVRLQNLTLSYKLPAHILKKLQVNNLKVYVTGTNLLTITDWDGWDPETNGKLISDYPLLKTYSVGVNFEF